MFLFHYFSSYFFVAWHRHKEVIVKCCTVAKAARLHLNWVFEFGGVIFSPCFLLAILLWNISSVHFFGFWSIARAFSFSECKSSVITFVLQNDVSNTEWTLNSNNLLIKTLDARLMRAIRIHSHNFNLL